MSDASVRIDKWLWAARFFKTRSLATAAIEGGHVHANGVRPKASRAVQIGDILRIQTPGGEFTITVTQLSDQRRGAPEAALLFTESQESIEKRSQTKSLAKLAPVFHHPDIKGRPTKKWRRQLHQFECNQE
ncbi:RNA-binding S4 domain-containing protein [Burkholderiaceae bacterium DAT-1]|nr:RNA-binding S4 domain-containing protein [Burkholderiaceae bacterium DAT-1]